MPPEVVRFVTAFLHVNYKQKNVITFRLLVYEGRAII